LPGGGFRRAFDEKRAEKDKSISSDDSTVRDEAPKALSELLLAALTGLVADIVINESIQA
jgi:hypothetical protein